MYIEDRLQKTNGLALALEADLDPEDYLRNFLIDRTDAFKRIDFDGTCKATHGVFFENRFVVEKSEQLVLRSHRT